MDDNTPDEQAMPVPAVPNSAGLQTNPSFILYVAKWNVKSYCTNHEKRFPKIVHNATNPAFSLTGAGPRDKIKTQQTAKHAGMAELADVQDLGSCAARRVGSSPTTRTNS